MSATSNRRKYIVLKASGLCVRCGVEPASDGRIHCSACAEQCAQKNSRRWEKLKEELPDHCSMCRRNKPAPGMKSCASCRILRNAENRKRAEKVRALAADAESKT